MLREHILCNEDYGSQVKPLDSSDAVVTPKKKSHIICSGHIPLVFSCRSAAVPIASIWITGIGACGN